MHWKGQQDITDDGGVAKAVVQEGKDWKKPNGQDEVLGRNLKSLLALCRPADICLVLTELTLCSQI